MHMLVPQKGLTQNFHRSFPLRIVANLTITSMVLFVMVADVVAWTYQEIYFGIKEIPKIPRSKFVKMQRHKIPGLSFFQKWSCWYCEYVNGVVTWIKALTNQTEAYSCAIKYSHTYPGQEYQKDFFEAKSFAEGQTAKH